MKKEVYNQNELRICFNICPDEISSIEELDVESILAEFAKYDFNVTYEAIEHNFNAWLNDYKSGYRDEDNQYHLFTPCGCNPLSFTVSRLNGSDWQITYTC